MPTTVQIVITAVLASAALVWGYLRVRIYLFPPSALDGRVVSPAERAELVRAELVVRRAIRRVRWPGMGFIFAVTIASSHLPAGPAWAIMLGGGFVVSVAWQMFGMRRWWRWAVRQGADLYLVEELAEDAVLVARHDSWWGRRQRRTWMRLPAVASASELGRESGRLTEKK